MESRTRIEQILIGKIRGGKDTVFAKASILLNSSSDRGG